MIRLLQPSMPRTRTLFKPTKLKYLIIIIGIIGVLDLFGAFTHLFEYSYDRYFTYPYEGDVFPFVDALKHNHQPKVQPINEYNLDYIFNLKDHCVDNNYHNLRIVFLIKSALKNFEQRNAIRNSWGFKKRFFDVPTRTLFLLGINNNDNELQYKINQESIKYKDILQAKFIDSYYNNTIKTMMGINWAFKNCLNSKFYMFVDDDMYVSVKNVLAFIRNPAFYPDYLKEPSRMGKREANYYSSDINETHVPINISDNTVLNDNNNNNTKIRKRRQIFDIELPDNVRLFAGYVFKSSPHRHKTSKWYISLNEYPYDYWPPYVTAGAYILSKNALVDMYYTSLYTKHFKFDDIYLGLVAKKADIEPFHCDEFHFYKRDYTPFNYKYVIVSHGYNDPNELLQVWNEQKALGNA